MVCRTLGLAVLAALGSSLSAAQTGDFDGDGRLSIADVVCHGDSRRPAPGSVDGFEAYPCYADWKEVTPSLMGGILYLECLRRSVPDPMPHWVPLWTGGSNQTPLRPDPRVLVSWDPLPAESVGGDRVRLRLLITNLAPVRAFSLIVES